jgi:tight adherence protein B
MELDTMIVAILAMIAVGGIFYVFAYPHLSGEVKAAKRQAALGSASVKPPSDRHSDAAGRRKQVADSLKEIEARGKSKKATLEARIAQAGLAWNRKKFFIISGISGSVAGLLMLVLNGEPLTALAAAGVGGFGFPAWLLSHLRKRRLKKFINEFPNAVDIIIRGVKAGLPVGDCLRIIASEAAEPVRGEFRQIVEAQAMGLSVGEAVERIVVRVPTAEANFFSIVINIQQKAGGSLAEALNNLSSVLRERKKIKGKITAMSSEAKASAYIIGSLPFIVGGLVYLTSPDYLSLLWKTTTGLIVLAVSGCWMLMGVFMMKNMINFDI